LHGTFFSSGLKKISGAEELQLNNLDATLAIPELLPQNEMNYNRKL